MGAVSSMVEQEEENKKMKEKKTTKDLSKVFVCARNGTRVYMLEYVKRGKERKRKGNLMQPPIERELFTILPIRVYFHLCVHTCPRNICREVRYLFVCVCMSRKGFRKSFIKSR